MSVVTATEIKNNFGKFLQEAISGEEVIITKNGKEIARLISKEKTVSFLIDKITGIIDANIDEKSLMKEKYEKYAGIN